MYMSDYARAQHACRFLLSLSFKQCTENAITPDSHVISNGHWCEAEVTPNELYAR